MRSKLLLGVREHYHHGIGHGGGVWTAGAGKAGWEISQNSSPTSNSFRAECLETGRLCNFTKMESCKSSTALTRHPIKLTKPNLSYHLKTFSEHLFLCQGREIAREKSDGASLGRHGFLLEARANS